MLTAIKNWVNGLNATKKLLISFFIGVVAYFVFPFNKVPPLMQIVFGWDWFTICQLTLSWITFYSITPLEIKKQAPRQDDRGPVIFFIVLISTFLSMMAVVLLLVNKPQDMSMQALRLIIAISCMVLSWFLVHTIFAVRYAHLFYYEEHGKQDKETKEVVRVGGLNFPKTKEPDFLDFAYFSFTAGMTFQVSDVEITSKKLRRLALLHCLISFGYNATIIALSVNIIGGLSQ